MLLSICFLPDLRDLVSASSEVADRIVKLSNICHLGYGRHLEMYRRPADESTVYLRRQYPMMFLKLLPLWVVRCTMSQKV